MYFGLIGRGGNVLDWIEDEDEAREALYQMVADEPGLAEDLALLAFDEDGSPVGDPIKVSMTRVVVSGDALARTLEFEGVDLQRAAHGGRG